MFKPKQFIVAGACLFLGWVVMHYGFGEGLIVQHASAAAGDPLISSDIMTNISGFMSMMITIMDVGMWVIFKLLNVVMDPATIFDQDITGNSGILEMMHNIWMLSRDLMNLIFAFLLIIGAVYIVVQPPKGKEFVGSYAAKFVMAVVFVNFSWFVPRVIFDFSQVAAYTVYQLPSLIESDAACQVPPVGGAKGAKMESCEVVTNVLFLSEIERSGVTDGKDGWRCPVNNFVCYQAMRMDDPNLEASPTSKIINGIIINHARLRSLVYLADPGVGAARVGDKRYVAMLTFIIKLSMVFIIHIALFFPMLALLVAFFLRIPILWLTMAFMPFVFLEFVVGNKFGEHSPMQYLWQGFLKAAFMPALVGIPLSIGFILLNAGNNIAPPARLAAGVDGIIPVFSDVHTFWQLLWMMLALGILWFGVFSVLKGNSIIGGITNRIGDFGKNAGKLALQAPLALPILPIGANGKSIMEAMHDIDPQRHLNELRIGGRFGGLNMTPGTNTAVNHFRANPLDAAQRVTVNAIINNRPNSDVDFRQLVNNLHALPALNRVNAHDIATAIAHEMNIRDAATIRRMQDAAAPGGPPPPP